VPKYVLDTNLYIRATRDNVWHAELEAFVWSHAPDLHLHSVVAGELLAGALDSGLKRKTEERFIAPFEAVGRVITPGHGAWKRAGDIVAGLVRAKHVSSNGLKRSLLNDCLIAASAQDHGFTLITDNAKDFALINKVARVNVVPPWPS
jgi:predicted nucleic acid-binding protein